MEELAPAVRLLRSRPAYAFNCYLVDDVLVDAATRWARRRILRDLRGHRLAAHAITHAHADHQGASAAVCDALGIPFWAGANEVDVAQAGVAGLPSGLATAFQRHVWAGPGHRVDRALREGDAVGSFVVLDTPGHAVGHISLWRESDRVLIAGDVFFGCNPVTGRPGLRPPPDQFTPDPERNRAAMRRLAELRPTLACFGHGPPVRDPGVLAEVAARVS